MSEIKTTDFREGFGKGYGFLLGAVTATVSTLRQSRTFHPRGKVYVGSAVPLEGAPWSQEIAHRLAGKVLARFSTALWKNEKEWPDVLGIAFRFRSARVEKTFTAEAEEGDQDLLFATVEKPAFLGLAPFTTNAHDFFRNEYFAVSPFSFSEESEGTHFYFRLTPKSSEESKESRAGILASRVQNRRAIFILSVRKEGSRDWNPILKIDLESPVDLDQEKLRFFPFRSGAGIHPRGWIHYMRIGAYRMSQKARPHSEAWRAIIDKDSG